MSPTALKNLNIHLLTTLLNSSTLCMTILTSRRVGSTHESLDRLHLGLKSTHQALEVEYAALRKVYGSRFDLGDETSRQALKAAVRTLELDVERRLNDIALRRNDGLPGFREMLRIVQRTEDAVSDALAALGQRLDRPVPLPTPKPKASEASKPKPKAAAADVLVSAAEWDRVTAHMKNSWMETVVDGRILYVNCFDEHRNTWEKPSRGFIQPLPIIKDAKPRTSRPSTRVYGEEQPIPVREARRPREQSRVRRSPQAEWESQHGGW